MPNTQLIKTTWSLLRITLGLLALFAGLDKFFDILADWDEYISAFALDILPFEGQTFMYIVGVIEIVAGIIVFSKWTEFGGYLIAVWLTLVAINLIMLGTYDIAVRDLVIAISALSLGLLTRAGANNS